MQSIYSGVVELSLSDTEIAEFYEKRFLPENLHLNEYIIIKDSFGNLVDKGKWTAEGFTPLKYKSITNNLLGRIKARNLLQELAFDLLQDDNIIGKCMVGGFGVGKSFLALAYALDSVISKNGKFDHVVFMRNNISTKNTVDIGALPSTLDAKLRPFALSMADIIGSETELDRFIEDGKIKLEHIGFVRGRSFRNSAVILSEAQNITQEQMAIIVSRIGENSILIVEGDLSQCDKEVFRKESGLVALIESLKDDAEFGVVTLKQNERSKFSALADKVMRYNTA